jgi:hypothetical protein
MNFSGKYEEAHCQALSMKADSKFGFISSSLLIGLGVLALIFSSWQLISFDAEENKLGLIKDKTIEPSDRNTGYRIYIVNGSCEDFTLDSTFVDGYGSSRNYELVWEKNCDSDLWELRFGDNDLIYVGTLSGHKDSDTSDYEVESPFTLNGSQAFVITDRKVIDDGLKLRNIGFILSGLGAVILAITRKRGPQVIGDTMNPALGFTLAEQMKAGNQTEALDCLKKLAVYMKENNLLVSSVFERFDLNSDGRINHFEFKTGLESIGVVDISTVEINSVIKFLDTDGDGTVDYDELKAYFDSENTWD